MNNAQGQPIQITASTSKEGPSSSEVLWGIIGGVTALTLACGNLPIESQPGIKEIDCSNGSSDILSIKAKLDSSPDDLKRITEYNIGLNNIGVSVDNPSTIVTRFEGIDRENNGGFVEMAVSQAPLGGSEDLGTQTIVSFKSEEGTLEAFSFNPADDTNLIVREVPASGNTVVFFAGRSFGGDTGTTMFMQLNFDGMVTPGEVIELLSKGDHSKISRMVVLNPLTDTCCVVTNNSQLNEQRADLEFLNQFASLNTDAGVPIVNSSESPTPAPSTKSPTPTRTPIPATPTKLATATPKAIESGQGQALLGLGYEQAQLKEFTSFAEGDYSFPGDTVTYHGIIGTKADGSKEMLAIKFSDNPNYLKLSGTETLKLAKEACAAGACFSHHFWGDNKEPITFVKMVSTGILLSNDKKDESGNVTASNKSLLALTLNDQGFPLFLKGVVEIEDPSNPGIDLLNNNILDDVFNFANQDSNRVHSLEELAKFFQKGKGMQMEFGIQEIGFIGGEKVKGWQFFKDTFGSDPNYQSALRLFLSDNGVTQTGNDPIMFLLTTSK